MQNRKKTKRYIKVCYGISSQAGESDNHIFMSDYDGYSLESVVNHLRPIQKEFNLSDIFIIESTNGFNALSLDLLPNSLIYMIGSDVYSIADHKFFKYGFDRGYYTLRFDKDKKLVRILRNNSMKYKKSLAHKLFLEWFFDIKIDGSNNNFDDNKKIRIIQYRSEKHGFHSVVNKETVYDRLMT